MFKPCALLFAAMLVVASANDMATSADSMKAEADKALADARAQVDEMRAEVDKQRDELLAEASKYEPCEGVQQFKDDKCTCNGDPCVAISGAPSAGPSPSPKPSPKPSPSPTPSPGSLDEMKAELDKQRDELLAEESKYEPCDGIFQIKDGKCTCNGDPCVAISGAPSAGPSPSPKPSPKPSPSPSPTPSPSPASGATTAAFVLAPLAAMLMV